MRRVVLDTTVIVSGTLTPEGDYPAKILDAWRDGQFALVISEGIIDEVKRVLSDPQLRGKYENLTRAHIGRLINLLRRHSIMVPGRLNLQVIEEDPDDNMLLIAAIEGDAEEIVSGDEHLISLKQYRGIKIVTPAAFAKSLG